MTINKKNPPPAEYDVGFGKPPKHGQFQKGQSGNPRGRPKGVANLATSLERAMNERVFITENGQRKQISKLDAAVKQVVNKATSGDARAFQQIVSLARLVGGTDRAVPEALNSQADQQVLQQIVARFQAASAASDADKEKDTP